jgi:tRNA(Ile)-lysidine synthase
MISFESFVDKWSSYKSSKVFVGLSGGVDSVVLLRLLHQSGFDITALHINYHLRGKESDEDEYFVRKLCDNLNVEIFVKKINAKEILEERGGNLQDVARTIRYEFFNEFLNKHPNSVLALGHHQDDQIETFFLNIARKSGLRGLACMLEIDHHKIRPLLVYAKKDIIKFALENNWFWREDQSNKTLKYRRNALRNKYIPEMVSNFPGVNDSVLLLIKSFQNELSLIRSIIYPIFIDIMKGGILLDSIFLKLNENEKIELLFSLELDYSDCLAFFKLEHAQVGKCILTKSGFKIYREKAGYSFEKWFKIKPFEISIKEVKVLPETFSKNEFYFDLDKIKGEIKLRKWAHGDKIKPIGLKGSKLISDVLISSDLYVLNRLNWFVLVDEDTILACPQLCVSREKVATKNTLNILKVIVL